MKKYSLLILSLSIVMLLPCLAAAYEIELPDSCRRDYRIVELDDTGRDKPERNNFKVVEFSNWFCETEWEGRPVAVFKRLERTKQGDEITSILIMESEKLTPLAGSRKMTSRTGKVVSESRRDYRDPVYNIQPGTYQMEALGPIAHRFDLTIGAAHNINMMTGPGESGLKMSLSVEEEETVKVPAGEFLCKRVRMQWGYEQFLGKRWGFAKGFITMFSPDYFFWVESKPPYGLIKVQGKFGPPGAVPEVAHELVKAYDEK